ncbi:MAG: twitch domain-containing radical SAM protein [Bdellovibrionales bacterium]|nr:twitch domain-containing radical SAM protein [Bdellovibrionales bacterium]
MVKNDDGKPANLNHTDLLSGWNNYYMRSIRKQMLAGEIPPSCAKCFKEESAGHRSKRNWETEYWNRRVDTEALVADTQEDGSVPAKMYYVDLRLGTKCNLKCVMCSPHDSSLWVSDWKKLYPNLKNPELKELMQWNNKGQVDGASYDWHKDNPKFWEQLYDQIPHMKQLYFAGGESTIIKEHYDLLEECIKRGHAKNIELRYNSNGTEMPERMFELWKNFKRVRFHFSIDSIFAMNDYIRFPSKWDHIEKQFERLDRTDDNVEVTIACAVQMLNMYYIPDFIKWKLSKNYKKINPWPLGAGLINYHFVYHPAHLNVKVFPKWMKEKIEAKYEEFYQWLLDNYRNDEDFLDNAYGLKRLKGMVRFMNSGDWSQRMPQFIEYINKMDTIRGTNFREVFPEMAELLDEEVPEQTV